MQRDTHRLCRTRIRMLRRSWREACASLRLHVEKPSFLQFLQVVLTTLLAASKTNPEPAKPLALKSRVVVEFTADDGLVTRNKSTACF